MLSLAEGKDSRRPSKQVNSETVTDLWGCISLLRSIDNWQSKRIRHLQVGALSIIIIHQNRCASEIRKYKLYCGRRGTTSRNRERRRNANNVQCGGASLGTS